MIERLQKIHYFRELEFAAKCIEFYFFILIEKIVAHSSNFSSFFPVIFHFGTDEKGGAVAPPPPPYIRHWVLMYVGIDWHCQKFETPPFPPLRGGVHAPPTGGLF